MYTSNPPKTAPATQFIEAQIHLKVIQCSPQSSICFW